MRYSPEDAGKGEDEEEQPSWEAREDEQLFSLAWSARAEYKGLRDSSSEYRRLAATPDLSANPRSMGSTSALKGEGPSAVEETP